MLFEGVRAFTPAERSPFVDAQLARYDAHVASRRGDAETADLKFRRATALLREIGYRYWLGVALLEHAEWLGESDRGAEAELPLAECREIFEQLRAAPWLERVDAREPTAA
jgi:hypothetical protein